MVVRLSCNYKNNFNIKIGLFIWTPTPSLLWNTCSCLTIADGEQVTTVLFQNGAPVKTHYINTPVLLKLFLARMTALMITVCKVKHTVNQLNICKMIAIDGLASYIYM